MGIDHIFSSALTSVNKAWLHDELVTAGLDVESVSGWHLNVVGDLKITFAQAPTAPEIATAQGVIDAHDATDFEAIVKAGAQAGFAAIPGWASWDEATALQWVTDNITDPLAAIPDEAAIDAMSGAEFQAAAKNIIADQRAVLDSMNTAFRAVARAIIYLRNETWPGMQE